MARPSSFTQEIADKICGLIAEGISLRAICQADDMPDKSTVFRWLAQIDTFRDQYARARETQADALAEEILEIADTPLLGVEKTIKANGDEEVKEGDMIAHRRLQVDARKWLASKMAPKKYGDKLETTIQGGLKLSHVKQLSEEDLERIAAGGSTGTAGEA